MAAQISVLGLILFKFAEIPKNQTKTNRWINQGLDEFLKSRELGDYGIKKTTL